MRPPTPLPPMLRGALAAAWLWAGLTAGATPVFRQDTALTDLGLRLPLMRGAVAVPLPPLTTYRYTLTRGSESWQEDRYEPRALWYATQHLGEWRDNAGTTLVLGVVSAWLPAGFAERHVTREHFEQLAASGAARSDRPDEGALHRWMLDFTGWRLGTPVSPALNRARLAELLAFPSDDPRTHAFAFRMDPRRAGQAHVADSWFALVVVTPGADPAGERAAVERELIGGLSATGRFEGRQVASRFQSRNPEAAVREHPSRDAARRSIAHLDDWWSLDSEDYIVLSNNRTAERFARDLLADLQTARELFARIAPGFAPSRDEVAIVRIFDQAAEYEAYVGGEHTWSAGVFDAARRELVLRPPAVRGRDAQYQRIQRVAVHEALHQYLFLATGGLTACAWFNEGHATLFEGLSFGRRPTIEENSERIDALLRQLSRGPPDLARMLSMSYREFYGGSDADREAAYSLAWGLAYYLQRAAPLERNRPHAEILGRYMQALEHTRNPAAATAFAFEGIALDAFTRSFVEFWRTPRHRAAARRAPLP